MPAFLKPCLALVVACGLACPGQAAATVFYSLDEVPALAFPEATRTETTTLFLSPDQHQRIEAAARTRLDSDLIKVYSGYKQDEPLGYALLDTHIVRTLPEAFLTVLSPDGRVRAVHVLAFYEPLEYLPSARWLEQLKGKRLGSGLRIGRDLAAVTGSTLSSRAVVSAVGRALAVYEEVIAASPTDND